MSLRAGEIAALVAEAEPFLSGARVKRVLGAGARDVVLEFETPRGCPALLLSTHPDLSRLHLLRRGAPRRASPSPLAARLDRRLGGSVLERIECAAGDRVVRLLFDGKKPTVLVAELFGRASNLLLLESAGRILEVERRVKGKSRTIDRGLPYVAPPIPTRAAPEPPRFDLSPFSNLAAPLNVAVEEHYAAAAKTLALEEAKRSLLGRIAARLKNRRARTAGLRRRLEETSRAEALRREGELLKANWARLRRGLAAIEVVDFFDPEQPTVRIELDPSLDPRGNVERAFRRSRKLLDAGAPLQGELARVAAEIGFLEEADRRTRGAGDPDAVSDLSGELEGRGLLRPPPAARAKRDEDEPRRPTRFLSADGFEILVGGDARENDRLTFGLARGNDLWLHARGIPGAHVLVRLPRGKTAPLETLLDAAALAAHFSKGRLASKSEVVYTPAKFVRRPRGGAPGLAMVVREKTILVARDAGRLERLLRPPVDPPSAGR